MAQLHYCFIAVFAIFSVKLVISDECNEKRTTITNEEHIDESESRDTLLHAVGNT